MWKFEVETREVNQAVRNNPGKFREGYIFEPHESGNLKVIKDLPVVIDGEECIIKPGEEIVITGCPSDGSKEIYFRVVSTGEEGIISYKKTTTEFFEIAGVSHYDYFENVLEFSD